MLLLGHSLAIETHDILRGKPAFPTNLSLLLSSASHQAGRHMGCTQNKKGAVDRQALACTISPFALPSLSACVAFSHRLVLPAPSHFIHHQRRLAFPIAFDDILISA